MQSYIPNIQRITIIQISKNFDMSSYHEATCMYNTRFTSYMYIRKSLVNN